MKNSRKVIFLNTLILLLVCGLYITPLSANAAKRKNHILKYKNKTITLGNFNNVDDFLKKIKKAWGEPDSLEYTKMNNKTKEGPSFTYKKGRNEIRATEYGKSARYVMVEVDIKDKKTTANGIKIGTSKTKAMKQLRKKFGKKNVRYIKSGYNAQAGKCISVRDGYYEIRKGKVTLYWFVSCFEIS